jgi:predicted nucleic acid-binding protein
MTAAPIVLDTSVILNLVATGHVEGILGSLRSLCLVATAAAGEVIYIRADDPAQPAHPVSIEPWISAKLITIVSLEEPKEEDLYVQFASELDDGEAMSLAICRARGYVLATDDRKARRLAGSLTPTAVALLSTAEILHSWALETAAQSEPLRQIIQAIERRARFLPPQGAPFRDWWLSRR